MLPTGLKKALRKLRAAGRPPIPVTVPYEIRVSGHELLKDRVALVTGASGAIGRAIACHLAAEGAIVHVCGTTRTRIDPVVAEITALGGRAVAQILDVTDEASIQVTFSAVMQDHGRLDIMVHSAGGSARNQHAPLIAQKTEVIDEILNVNLRGAILCSREAARLMVPARAGRIIVISSVLGVQGKADFAEYAASKGGVLAFIRSIAMELGRFGITANCVSPGIVQRGEIDATHLARLKRTNWMESYGKPEDVAGMVAYLATDLAGFVTGQNLIVDGGRSLGLKGD